MKFELDEKIKELYLSNKNSFNILFLIKFENVKRIDYFSYKKYFKVSHTTFYKALNFLLVNNYITKNNNEYQLITSKKESTVKVSKDIPSCIDTIINFLKTDYSVLSTKTPFKFDVETNLNAMAEEFYNYYNNKAWQKVKDWKATLRAWYNKDLSKLRGGNNVKIIKTQKEIEIENLKKKNEEFLKEMGL